VNVSVHGGGEGIVRVDPGKIASTAPVTSSRAAHEPTTVVREYHRPGRSGRRAQPEPGGIVDPLLVDIVRLRGQRLPLDLLVPRYRFPIEAIRIRCRRQPG
jgi:hypothetical protein